MLARAISIALLVVSTFGITTPLLAGALQTKPRCCHTTACPMMKRGAGTTRWTTCDPEQQIVRGTSPAAILTQATTLPPGHTTAHRFDVPPTARPFGVSYAVDHPPRSFAV